MSNQKVTIRQPVSISSYSGYRHNRYDGYNCSRGVLAALGASPRADAFADSDDYPDADFERAYNGEDPEIGTGENDDFREAVLQNLDCDLDDITELEPGESYHHKEFWGAYQLDIIFTRTADGKLTCVFDGYGPFEVTDD